jgi:hypothetical protein
LRNIPFGNVDGTLLTVDNNGIVERLEIEALVSTVDEEVGLASLHLSAKSCQNHIGRGRHLLDQRILVGVDERADRVSPGQILRKQCVSPVAQGTSSSVANSVILVESSCNLVVVKLDLVSAA